MPQEAQKVESIGTRLPPQDIEAEQSVLGGIMLENEAIFRVLETLSTNDFYRESHRKIFKAMIQLSEKAEPIDLLTLGNSLREQGGLEGAGGTSYLSLLVDNMPTSANIVSYAKIVREKSILRSLIQSATEIVTRGYEATGDVDNFLDHAEKLIFEIAQSKIRQSFYPLKMVVKDCFKMIEGLYERKESVTGVPTGFVEFDRLTAGLQPSDLIIVAGRPSMGKTAFALNIAAHAAQIKKIPCAIFSLEMSKEQLVQRLLCSEARVDASKLRSGFLSESDWPKLTRAAGHLSEIPLFIDDTAAINILEMRAKARRLQREHGLGLIVVDYLQLVRGMEYTDNREREISEISRSLKALAKELSVPVIALSQLNRMVENRKPPIPILADLRECVTGETLVLLADGRRVPIHELVGSAPEVLAVEDGKVICAQSDKVWKVGKRPVWQLKFASGRFIRVTEKHRLLTGRGWKQMREMVVGERIALARSLPEPKTCEAWSDDQVILLAHLIGNGSYLTHQPLRYTTSSEDNSRVVQEAAERHFGVKVHRHESGKSWHQLVFSGKGNHWHPSAINAWLRGLDIFNQRSYQKRIPEEVFRLSNRQIALMLQHLWATDGSITTRKRGSRGSHSVYYSTNSVELASGVAFLLLRLGMVARIHSVRQGFYRPAHHVIVSGVQNQLRFLSVVGAFGPRLSGAERLIELLGQVSSNTNVDTLPLEVFETVKAVMGERGTTQRAMASLRGTSYGGTAHFGFSPSRDTLQSCADLLQSQELQKIATSDLFWDRLVAVEFDGETEVYDLTVPGPASWLADGIVSHNSGAIEQDADVIAFVFREEVYDRETVNKGTADIIIGKQRNGPIGSVRLAFISNYTRFENLAQGI